MLKHQGTVHSIGNPTTTLEELFVRVIAESEAHPGRRVRAEQAESYLGRRSKVRPWLSRICKSRRSWSGSSASGWYNGLLWQPLGIVLLVVLLAGGGLGLLFALRRSSAAPGRPSRCGSAAFSGPVAAGARGRGLVPCGPLSTAITRDLLTDYIASPLFKALVPLLGSNWSGGALYTWLAVATGLTGVVYACGWLAAILVGGPLAGTRQCGRAVVDIAIDIARISPRRVFALAWLAVRESLRRRVVVVFVVFVVLILFAALFIKKDSPHPGQLYIQVVLNFTIYLSMLFSLVLSAEPAGRHPRPHAAHRGDQAGAEDRDRAGARAGIRLRGHGPAGRHRPDQLWLHRAEPQSHAPTDGRHAACRIAARQPRNAAAGHDQPVARARARSDDRPFRRGHRGSAEGPHPRSVCFRQRRQGVYTLGPPIGQLQARVPIYGKLSFLDKTGKPKEKGINVGDEWTYRSFIEGRTAAAAIWTFDGLSEDLFPESKFPNGIPVEMTIEVFRTYKGNQEKGVAGTISLGNPKTGKKVFLRNFLAKKFATDVQMIPRSFITAGSDGKAETIDLFRDLVSDDGRLEITLQCLEPQQYYGMAQADLYIRAADSSFAWNFCKGYLGIWLQMALVISLGVMFSTFLSGPVALLATMFVDHRRAVQRLRCRIGRR